MILYRVVHVGWREYPWEIGTTETIHKGYYHSTKEAAIEHCAELHDNPLEFMLSLADYQLHTVESDGRIIARSVGRDEWVNATLLSIESLS